ncbi:MAG: dockerin type I domain-containing protein [Dehalococcoidia bacterium]
MRVHRFLVGLALILITLLAGVRAPARLQAELPPPTPHPDSLDIGNIHIMPSEEYRQQLAASAPAVAGNPPALLTYHGGAIMPSVTTYAIFWLPPGQDFEASTGTVAGDVANDTHYEALISRFLGDLAGSAFYSLLTQYSTPTQQLTANYSFGGSYSYAAPYPNQQSTTTRPLFDADILQAVQSVMQTNGLTAGLTHQFLVYTGYNVQVCSTAGQDCSASGGTCGHHSSSGDSQTPLLFTPLPDVSYLNAQGVPAICTVTKDAQGRYYAPNNDPVADGEISLTSHELFETASDPVLLYNRTGKLLSGGWRDSAGAEIGDKCVGIFGTVASDGSNITFSNGHKYIIQEEWSNQAFNGAARSGCTMALGAPGMPNSNDSFANAQPITAFPFQTIQSTFGFSTEPSDPALRCTPGASKPQDSASVWFRLTAPGTGQIWARTDVRDPATGTVDGTSYDTILAVFAGASPAPSSLLACNNNLSATDLSSAVTNISVTAGATYYLEVTSWDRTPGGTLALQVHWMDDVNADGQVSAVDALCVLRSVAGLTATTACPVLPLGAGSAGDVNGDSQVNAVDALCILRRAAGLVVTAACSTSSP